MAEGIVQFEVEITALSEIRSRVIWPGGQSPWIEGGIEELMVHFTYAGWTAYMLDCAMGLALSSHEDSLGKVVSDMLTQTIEAMGAIQMAEVRLTKDALDELRDDRIDP